MRPTFDDKDAGLLAQRQAARDARAAASTLPLVGDLVEMPDGSTRRVTRVGSTSIQLTQPEFDASFYIDHGGLCDFSGALDFGHPLDAFTAAGRGLVGVWLFHHDEVRAHNRVDGELSVTRWRRAL